MKIIDYYIFKQLLKGIITVLLIMSFIGWFSQSIGYLSFITEYGLSFFGFIEFTTMLMPEVIYNILPISVFAAILFVYNKLNLEKELIVIKSAGFSNNKLTKPVYVILIFVLIISYILNFKIIPDQNQKFDEYKWKIRNDLSFLMLKEEEFNNITDGLVLYIKEVKVNILDSILIYENRSPNKENIIYAEKGKLVKTKNGLSLAMINGITQNKDTKSNNITFSKFESYTIDLGVKTPKRIDKFRTRDMNLIELIENKESLYYLSYLSALHKRVILPLHGIILAFIALIAVLKSKFQRTGNSLRITLYVLLALGIQLFLAFLINLMEDNKIFIPLNYLVIIFIITTAVYYLNKETKPNRTK